MPLQTSLAQQGSITLLGPRAHSNTNNASQVLPRGDFLRRLQGPMQQHDALLGSAGGRVLVGQEVNCLVLVAQSVQLKMKILNP